MGKRCVLSEVEEYLTCYYVSFILHVVEITTFFYHFLLSPNVTVTWPRMRLIRVQISISRMTIVINFFAVFLSL